MAKRSTVTGGKAISRALRQLTPGLTVPINEASRRAMRPMLRAARANAPVDDGDLKRSLTVTTRKGTTLIGPRSDYVGKDGARPVRSAHIVEFGRAANADGIGGAEGTRFLSRAFDATAPLVLKIFGAEIGPAIERRALKLAAKAALK